MYGEAVKAAAAGFSDVWWCRCWDRPRCHYSVSRKSDPLTHRWLESCRKAAKSLHWALANAIMGISAMTSEYWSKYIAFCKSSHTGHYQSMQRKYKSGLAETKLNFCRWVCKKGQNVQSDKGNEIDPLGEITAFGYTVKIGQKRHRTIIRMSLKIN